MKEVLGFIGGVLPIVAALVTMILKYVKSAKAREKLEKVLEIQKVLQRLVEEAEQILGNGEQKKLYVLGKLSEYCEGKNMSVDAREYSEFIDELVATTKKVNV